MLLDKCLNKNLALRIFALLRFRNQIYAHIRLSLRGL